MEKKDHLKIAIVGGIAIVIAAGIGILPDLFANGGSAGRDDKPKEAKTPAAVSRLDGWVMQAARMARTS